MQGVIHNGTNHSCDTLSLPRPGPGDVDTEGNDTTLKRRLLLIYVHGFMGSEASFLEFPAHVHDMLTALLSESHSVYTRIYPRYKSHGEIQTAAAQFSAWLAPHEAEDLDIILLGHSLGGIVSADVALLEKHQILGLVNFDVPFLGLHPRVVPTGILSSMPKKDVAPEEKLADEQESLGMTPAYKPAAPDPNFNRPWKNDIRLPNRGFLKGVMHFVNKNTDNLARSVFDRVVSSAKFAGCVNNYSELRQRYRNLMELESGKHGRKTVKFINYYTASTGRKKPKKNDSTKEDSSPTIEPEENEPDPDESRETSTSTLGESLENLDISEVESKSHGSVKEVPTGNPEAKQTQSESETGSTKTPSTEEPIKSPSSSSNQSIGIQLEREITPTPSLSPEQTLREASLQLSDSMSTSTSETTNADTDPSSQKLRKFILLPKNHWKYHDNAHWTAVVMQDIDEVEAHQSMFIPQGAHYDHLVGDTVSLIERWVQDEMSWRLAREALD